MLTSVASEVNEVVVVLKLKKRIQVSDKWSLVSEKRKKRIQVSGKRSSVSEKRISVSEKRSLVSEKRNYVSEKRIQVSKKWSSVPEKRNSVSKTRIQVPEKRSLFSEKWIWVSEKRNSDARFARILVRLGQVFEVVFENSVGVSKSSKSQIIIMQNSFRMEQGIRMFFPLSIFKFCNPNSRGTHRRRGGRERCSSSLSLLHISEQASFYLLEHTLVFFDVSAPPDGAFFLSGSKNVIGQQFTHMRTQFKMAPQNLANMSRYGFRASVPCQLQ